MSSKARPKKMPNYDNFPAPPKRLVWLVWAFHQNGQTYLRAVATERSFAARARKTLLLVEPDQVVRVFIEQRETNHLYGAIQP